MKPEPLVARRQIEIINHLGLHLRPAEKFVRTADLFRSEIHVWFKGQSFDGRSILDLATLAAERGSRLELEATGPDADSTVNALANLVSAQFFEDENGNELGFSAFMQKLREGLAQAATLEDENAGEPPPEPSP
jgi:phosphocarrier protein